MGVQEQDTTEPPAALVEQLTVMGFTANQVKHALKQTGNNTERAIDYLFNHPEETGEQAEV